jgi:hypothetical protein
MRELTSGLEPLTCFGYEFAWYILARTGASGFPPIYAVFDDLAVSVCPLRTSSYQPGCSTPLRISDGTTP